MHRNLLIGAVSAAALFGFATHAHATEFSAKFSGFQEIGPANATTGAILSDGAATVDLDLNRAAGTLNFKLTYSALTSPVTQAHIHFGKVHVAGGVIVFFCSNLPMPPAGTQACPLNGGTVTGSITAANVIGPTAQNVTVGDFDALADALESNTAYGNIHTQKFPGGEIRGQIHRGERDEDEDR